MGYFKNNIKNNWKFYLSILILIVVGFFFCNSKRFLSVDEPLSYSLANEQSVYHPGWVIIPEEGWMGKDTFNEFGVISQRFNYAQVMKSQAGDWHPPFYYIILHTICSFFPGQMSIWLGLSISLVAYVLNGILIYMILNKLSSNKNLSALGVLIFTINHLVLSNLNLIRMYMLASTFVLIFIYFMLRIILDKEKKYFPLVFLTVLLGGLTHYYFYVAVASISLVMGIYLLIKKEFVTILLAIVSVASAIALNVLVIFRGTIAHLTRGKGGHFDQAYASLSGIDINRLYSFIKMSFYGNIGYFLGIIILISLLVLFFKKSERLNENDKIGSLLFVAYYIDILIVSQIATFLQDRYMFIMEVTGLMSFIYVTWLLFKVFNKEILAYVLAFLVIITNGNKVINTIIGSTQLKPSWEIAQENQNKKAVVLKSDEYDINISTLFLDLRWYEQTGVTSIKQPFENDIDDSFMCYVDNQLNEEAAFKYLKSQIKTNKKIEIKRISNTTTYQYNVYNVDLIKN